MMTNCGKYPQCETCVNREFDPFQCAECVDGRNYEPHDSTDDDTYEAEELSLSEFRQLLG